MDMGVAHSLSRCFFWSGNVLWKQDIGDRAVTVSLAERDLIVNTKAVGEYLATHNEEAAARKKESANGFANGNIHEKVVSENGNGFATLHQRSNGCAKGAFEALSAKTADSRSPNGQDSAGWKDRIWVGEGVDILWFRTLDHGQVFDKVKTRRPLVEAITEYSALTG